eukprot:6195813-Pleurochrysis_carterae.AAC.1
MQYSTRALSLTPSKLCGTEKLNSAGASSASLRRLGDPSSKIHRPPTRTCSSGSPPAPYAPHRPSTPDMPSLYAPAGREPESLTSHHVSSITGKRRSDASSS